MIIDTHTHIFTQEFDDDVNEVVTRAIDGGVEKMILPGIDSSSHQRLFDLCGRYPSNLLPAVGVHPTSINANFQSELDEVESLLYKYSTSVVAVGEVGLDLYWSDEFLPEQRDAFAAQVELSLKHNLPLIIHTRNAYDEMYDILESFSGRPLRGVFHSFDQTFDVYKKMSKFVDFYFGVGGVVTFKKSTIAATVRDIPLERLLLETDAPYLTPSPYRGKRNEPLYVKYVGEKIAELKDMPSSELFEATTNNAIQLFMGCSNT